jgi:hypothetical protein
VSGSGDEEDDEDGYSGDEEEYYAAADPADLWNYHANPMVGGYNFEEAWYAPVVPVMPRADEEEEEEEEEEEVQHVLQQGWTDGRRRHRF